MFTSSCKHFDIRQYKHDTDIFQQCHSISLSDIHSSDDDKKQATQLRTGGTGCAECAIAHPLFDKFAIETSFQQ